MSSRRTALVTGASRGIGLAIARRLAADGFDLTISARSADALKQVATELRPHGGRVVVIPADMASPESIDALADEVLAQSTSLDVLVLCAGVGVFAPLAELPLKRFDLQVAVNLRAPLALIQRFLPALRAAAAGNERGARVIAISSIAGMAAEPGLSGYSATKAALISLCESLIVDEHETGVSATAICPGFVDTDMSVLVREIIPPETMITREDIAELVSCLTRLSRWAAVPNIPVTRPGIGLWRA